MFIRILLIILIILLILCFAVGQFLISFSLKRHGIADRLWKGNPVDINKLTPGTPKFIIETNYLAAMEKVKELCSSEAHEKVSIKSRDGLKLVGHLFMSDKPTHNWMIAVHGYRDNPTTSILSYALKYREWGYNILAFDQRSNGESEGEYITMSYMEHFDLLDWIDFVIKKDPEAKIVLHGHSMGAATILMATGEKALPESVKCAIADCGFSSIMDEFTDNLKNMYNLPAFPFLYVANLLSMIEIGLDFRKGNVKEAAAKSKTPTFFIHGDADTFVPTRMVYTLYDAASCEKQLYIAKDAAHVDSQYIDPEKYYEQVKEFVEKYI